MFSKSETKVKFQDHQLDDYIFENSVLKSKLQSKIQALSIMSQELDKCSMERDRCKVLVEQLKNKGNINDKRHSFFEYGSYNSVTGGELLATTREENNMLKLQIELLQNKLEESSGDIIALRKQINSIKNNQLCETIILNSKNKCEHHMQEIEKMHNMNKQLQVDYETLLDEKEELMVERDLIKHKILKLNNQISYIIAKKANSQSKEEQSKQVLENDTIKDLQEKIIQLEKEKDILKQNLSKYKNLLDLKNMEPTPYLKNNVLDLLSQEHVATYLTKNIKHGLKDCSVTELKALCLGLFESLKDKSIALQRQQKTNDILMNKLANYEKMLEVDNSEISIALECEEKLQSEKEDLDSNETIQHIRERYFNNMIKGFSNISGNEKCFNYNYTPHNDIITMDRNHRTVLPMELEALVNEALAELRPVKMD